MNHREISQKTAELGLMALQTKNDAMHPVISDIIESIKSLKKIHLKQFEDFQKIFDPFKEHQKNLQKNLSITKYLIPGLSIAKIDPPSDLYFGQVMPVVKHVEWPKNYKDNNHSLAIENSERLDRVECSIAQISTQQQSNTKTYELSQSDFKLSIKGLTLTYNEKILLRPSTLELSLLSILLSKSGEKFLKNSVADKVYIGEIYSISRSEKFNKLISRLNNKIYKQTGVRNFIITEGQFMYLKDSE